jgi:Protein of unknown function (DUF3108)
MISRGRPLTVLRLGTAAVALTLLGAGPVPPPATPPRPAPLVMRYEAYVVGLPVVDFDFRLDEPTGSYVLGGQVRTVGLLRLFYRLDLHTLSKGAVASSGLHPAFHEQRLLIRGQERSARLDYAGDGTVATTLVPSADPGRPKPTPRQTLQTIDPLTALLAIGRTVARQGRCEGRFPVYDGRRRYDVVLSDDGVEHEASARYSYDGEVRRCAAAAVKIAGFSWDQDYSPHTTTGQVWFVTPKPGGPALPLRIDFGSSWGSVSVRMMKLDQAK